MVVLWFYFMLVVTERCSRGLHPTLPSGSRAIRFHPTLLIFLIFGYTNNNRLNKGAINVITNICKR